MHIVIVGCGRVGAGLGLALTAEGHTVAIIDKQRRAFRRLSREFDGQTVEGSGWDRDALEAAGIKRAEAFASVTSGDNSNILAARIARETFGIQRVVARIYDPRRAEVYQRLGIPTVATVSWTIDQVHRWLVPEKLPVVWSDMSGSLLMVDRVLPDHLAGKKLSVVEQDGNARLVAVMRAGRARLDGPQLVGQEGDLLHIAVLKENLDALDRLLSGGAVAGSVS